MGYRNAVAEPAYAARGHEMLAASWPQVVECAGRWCRYSEKWRAGVSSAFRQHTCACRKSNPNILVVQPAENWATTNVPG